MPWKPLIRTESEIPSPSQPPTTSIDKSDSPNSARSSQSCLSQKQIERKSTSISSAVRRSRPDPTRKTPLTWKLEGVLVAKKDFNLPKHNEIDTKNLYVSLNLSFYKGFFPSPFLDASVAIRRLQNCISLCSYVDGCHRSSKPANPSPRAATSRHSFHGNGTTTP